ncbi:MAG: VPLPA-CTERM sorting domain-containing protein, partial [Parvularculaceae bacterium]|nr:VPLPA-CTERM sorting domain-containing protein [Parvularculaceae bacterium]
FSSFFGFSAANQITIVEENGRRFDLFGLIAGPLSFATSSVATITVIGVQDFATNTFSAAQFTVGPASGLPVIYTNLEALIIFAGDDMGIDNVDLRARAAVPVPAALPLFGAALAGFAATRRRKKAA